MKEYQCSLEENEKLEQQNGDPRQQWMAAVDCGQQKISHLSDRQSFSCKLLRQIELSYCQWSCRTQWVLCLVDGVWKPWHLTRDTPFPNRQWHFLCAFETVTKLALQFTITTRWHQGKKSSSDLPMHRNGSFLYKKKNDLGRQNVSNQQTGTCCRPI